MPVSVSVLPTCGPAEMPGCTPASASSSWAPAKFAVIATVAPVIIAPASGSVTVRPGSIGVAGSFSV